MPKKAKKASFAPVTSAEKEGRLFVLAQNHNVVKIWKKGDDNKHDFTCEELNQADLLLTVNAQSPTLDFQDGPILMNFSFSGVPYFASGELVNARGDQKTFDVKVGELFKWERRKNFRLLTYPLHQVYVLFKLSEFSKNELGEMFQENKVKTQDDELFLEFLRLVGDPDLDDLENKEYFSCRVQDISTTGIAFYLTEMEVNCFGQDKQVKNFIIRFNGEEYPIDGGRIVYINKFSDPKRPDLNLFKVAIEFEKFSEATEMKLSKQINTEMREMDMNKTFEDFIQ